ncbi:MAG: 2-amino-3,7-dideoxy-D-threo-hept-6-ulosonate synthase [Verrucomicrobia bacterium]|nr:2-amino-3,7-dideoxy-D-threo-hept-6-ulosonate synthase [Verrucomicrobiota bacterium]MBU4246904.1 2-amino-3,7-dideoxy-D-threo-hept-6-ulosonate synthase [Verrucomicrobiota bacterium]MBU4291292.1 2-amino-3,7-dideoxy-D-threo-hept-6-ulosonate synthase [Verrucomicrobiota bacterium]MBU4496795.1 2-amino-3,7-dideoxy-D-threo-hept-6-ulosonate synthase [Verrucomicrobiota bacterium]MCG2680766.1 2-amino-3,7-dideoxy-D-threo-hept-6-ulosonate synthase [Kiritimatiellia bacterium]
MMTGKFIRLERIINRMTGKTVIVPMDHGVTVGPIPGLIDMKQAVDNVVNGGANAIIVHKGIVKAGHRQSGKDIGLIVHLSASTTLSPNPTGKVLVCSVEEAIQLGADGVSIHINLGAPTDDEMLDHFGQVSQKCLQWGLPLVAMMYTRGEKIKNEFDVKYVKHAARVGAELGADIVKVNYTGSPQTFEEVTQGCPAPVVIAGGEKLESDGDILTMVENAMKAGSAGVSIGRNAFQHADPSRMIAAISRIVHEKATAKEALKFLKEKR